MAQCTAHSKTRGERCRQQAIAGGHVCRYHGGAAPQVQAAAALRLAALVNPAIARLGKVLQSKTEGVAMRAVSDILDRNNMKGDNLIRLMNPTANQQPQVVVTEEMLGRMETLSPDELRIFLRVLGLLSDPGTPVREGPPQLTQ